MESTTVSELSPAYEQCTYCGTKLWMFITIFTAAIAILGNVLTIFAIVLSKRLVSVIANYFIFSLAVSDFLVGISVPYHMLFYILENFGNGKFRCLLRFSLLSFACSSSICNLLFIAMDRYTAIVYPLHYTRFVTRRTVFILVAIGWLVALSMAAVPFIWNEWHEGITCELVSVLPYNYLACLLLPMYAFIWITMLLLYTKICREASVQEKRIRFSASLQQHHCHQTIFRDSKSFQVMLMILGCFTICWLPYFIIILHARSTTDFTSATLYEIFFNLAMANSSMNPLIYAWKNTNFRKAFLCLVKCHAPDNHCANFVTNHVPSKKSSINGLCNVSCNNDDGTTTENMEMQTIITVTSSDVPAESFVVSTVVCENSSSRTIH